jgi:hypothetical protein
MNFRALPGWKTTGLTSVPDSFQHEISAPRPSAPVSGRQFARTATGSAFAATVGSRLWTPSLVEAASFAPVPIPGGSPALGGAYHVLGPAAFDPTEAEPVTITNLNAFVGLAYVSGMVTQTNTKRERWYVLLRQHRSSGPVIPQKPATASVSVAYVSNIGRSRAISSACFNFGPR